MTKGEQFLQELGLLMKKYNATIAFEVGDGSDTYGLYDEKMVCSVEDEDITITRSWCFDTSDLIKEDKDGR